MSWLRQHWAQLRSTLIGIVMIGLTVGGWYGYRMYQNRKMTEAQIAMWNNSQNMAAEAGLSQETEAIGMTDELDSELLQDEIVVWQGRSYRRSSHVKAILCMGVDRDDTMTETKELGEAGQADGIFLIAQDTARNSLKILMIPRDTMTEIGVLHPDGTPAGKQVRHLTLAYAYGDGRESSCSNVVESVSHLLCGFPITQYMAADLSVINLLNDTVDGVTVTVPTAGMEKKDSAFVQGSTITLKGEQAEAFVRYRDIEKDYSALYRMDQQQEYITGFFEAVKQKSKTDSGIVPKLFALTEENMVTNMKKEEYLKIAIDSLNGEGLTSSDFRTIPGNGVTTDTFDEFYADPNAIVPIMLELFYREI